MPPTIRADPILTCANQITPDLGQTLPRAQPCHGHLGGPLLHSPGKQHLADTHLSRSAASSPTQGD